MFKFNFQLKPTEFLNLDAILEGVMHRLVVRPLRARLYTLLAAWHSADVRRLHAAIERAQHATPLQLGIKVFTIGKHKVYTVVVLSLLAYPMNFLVRKSVFSWCRALIVFSGFVQSLFSFFLLVLGRVVLFLTL